MWSIIYLWSLASSSSALSVCQFEERWLHGWRAPSAVNMKTWVCIFCDGIVLFCYGPDGACAIQSMKFEFFMPPSSIMTVCACMLIMKTVLRLRGVNLWYVLKASREASGSLVALIKGQSKKSKFQAWIPGFHVPVNCNRVYNVLQFFEWTSNLMHSSPMRASSLVCSTCGDVLP